MQIAAAHTALPGNYYDQEALISAFRELWGDKFHNPARLEQLHRNVLVGGRHLALPMEAYRELSDFGGRNDAYIRCAVELGQQALDGALDAAGLRPADLDHLFFVSVTGLAAPSIDARLVNRMSLRSDIKRTPIFGLGCVAGAAGVARAADYLRAFPGQTAALLSVELCSLTLQREDLSVANLVASGLFGDGAAAVVMVGAEREAQGPKVVDTRSVFYPDTERVMGWDVKGSGFQVVLSADVPQVVRRHVRGDVEAFLAHNDLRLSDIRSFVCHPGGPKVLDAFEEALELPPGALQLTRDSLEQVGNLSSSSVLAVLQQTMATHRPPPGSPGLMLALGPGFCSELVLLRW